MQILHGLNQAKSAIPQVLVPLESEMFQIQIDEKNYHPPHLS